MTEEQWIKYGRIAATMASSDMLAAACRSKIDLGELESLEHGSNLNAGQVAGEQKMSRCDVEDGAQRCVVGSQHFVLEYSRSEGAMDRVKVVGLTGALGQHLGEGFAEATHCLLVPVDRHIGKAPLSGARSVREKPTEGLTGTSRLRAVDSPGTQLCPKPSVRHR